MVVRQLILHFPSKCLCCFVTKLPFPLRLLCVEVDELF